MQIVATNGNSVRAGHNARPPSSAIAPWPWQDEIKFAIRDPKELLRRLNLPLPDIDERDASAAAHASFRTFVPESWLRRIEPGNRHDPLLIQVLPDFREGQTSEGFVNDAVGDQQATRAAGLIHKYHGRVLLMPSGTCAINCRYCFRRNFPYETVPHSAAALDTALAEIEADPSIREVILSGGDPLMVTDFKLQSLLQQIGEIHHVTRLRIHTRFPVVVPQRITRELLDMLSHHPDTVWLVLHINHPREIDTPLREAMAQLVDAGIPLLNQAVLLRGVNDDGATLKALFETLVDLRCQPYYLHQLDRVTGTSHFEVPVEKGRELMQFLHANLPGYALPRYVTEIPGDPGKRVLA